MLDNLFGVIIFLIEVIIEVRSRIIKVCYRAYLFRFFPTPFQLNPFFHCVNDIVSRISKSGFWLFLYCSRFCYATARREIMKLEEYRIWLVFRCDRFTTSGYQNLLAKWSLTLPLTGNVPVGICVNIFLCFPPFLIFNTHTDMSDFFTLNHSVKPPKEIAFNAVQCLNFPILQSHWSVCLLHVCN